MKKCYCKYTEDGEVLGLCLRCFKMEVNAEMEGASRETIRIVTLLDALFPPKQELHNSKITILRRQIVREGEFADD